MATFTLIGFGPGDVAGLSGSRLQIDPGYGSATGYTFTITDDDGTWSGESGTGGFADDGTQQTTTVRDGNGNVVASGQSYLKSRLQISDEFGDTINLYGIEIGGTLVGYVADGQLQPGNTYGYVTSNVGSGNEPSYGALEDQSYDPQVSNEIQGTADDDSLEGGAGDDDIFFDEGDNTVSGGAGNDYLDDEIGFIHFGNDVLDGGAGRDSIYGGGGDDIIAGGTGDDELYGEAGSDLFTFEDGFGTDTVEGGTSGSDADILDFSAVSAPVTATFTGNTFETIFSGVNSVSFRDIEGLILTDTADSIDARARVEGINAELGAGGDLYLGAVGADTVTGGLGDDTIDGWSGDDSITGGTGNDVLAGGGGNDTVEGGDGDDELVGWSGDDLLSGGSGSDLFEVSNNGGAFDVGDDTIIGGETGVDYDTIDLNQLTVSVSVTYSQNEAGTILAGPDTIAFSEIEAIGLTEQGDDLDASLSSLGQTIDGRGGNDTIIASSAADIVSGGTGNDSIDLGAGSDQLNLEDGFGQDTVFGGTDAVEDDIDARALSSGINVLLSGDQAGTLTNGANSVEFTGIDDIDGTNFDDTYDLSAATTRIEVDTRDGNDSVLGGAGGDDLSGDEGDDTIHGGAGDDTLIGDTGNDSIDGGAGDDLFLTVASDGDNVYLGGTGSDTIAASEDGANVGFAGDFSAANSIEVISSGGFADIDIYSVDALSAYLDFSQTQLIGIAGIYGEGGADTIVGSAGADSIGGGSGNDHLHGGAGNDTLEGGDGDDQIWSEGGDDQIDGGSGQDRIWLEEGVGTRTVLGGETGIDYDTLDFQDSGATTGVTVTYTANEQGNFSSDSGNGGGAFSQIERLDSTGHGDTIDASATTDGTDIAAGEGDDIVTGGDGDDSILGEGGNDSIFAREGHDTVVAGDGDDTVDGRAGDDSIDGGAGNDVLRGDSGADTVMGGAGADTIGGWTGNDSLSGGDDADVFRIDDGFGADTIVGGEGVSTGTDSDRIDFSAVGVAVTVTYSGDEIGGATDGIDALTFSQIEALTLTAQNDSVDASATASGASIEGLAGDDTLIGGAGGDTLAGGDGDDYIEGGAGDDLLTTGLGQDTLLGGDGNDTLMNSDGDDSLDGGAGDDSIVATGGEDTLRGGTGDDTMEGGDDADTFIIEDGFGDDVITGGEGTTDASDADLDTIDLSQVTGPITVTSTGDEAGTITDGTDTITFTEIERVILTGNDDRFDGRLESVGTQVEGGAGNDTISGGDGDDTLDGGVGDDWLYAYAGNDTLDGGAGNDSLVGNDGNNLLRGGDGNDFIGSGAGNGTLDGGDGDDALFGNGGDDRLNGGAGSDTLSGGIGADLMEGGDDADNFVVEDNFGDDTITGGEGGANDSDTIDGGAVTADVVVTFTGSEIGTFSDGTDTIGFSQIENVFTGGGDDVLDAGAEVAGVGLFGNAGSDTIIGGTGDDYIEGGDEGDTIVLRDGFGSDTIVGGEGGDDDDIIDLSQLSGPVTVTYTGDDAGTITDGTDTITFSEIERVILTEQTDLVDASSDIAGTQIVTDDGNDTVIGGRGSDTINAGAGADTIQGEDGADEIHGGSGNDTLLGNRGSDTLYGGDGDDSIEGGNAGDWGRGSGDNGSSHDFVDGGAGNDTIGGGDGDDTIFGGAGDDILNGNGDDDVLDGGDDADTFVISHSGNDTIVGGEGGNDDDVIDLSQLSRPVTVTYTGDEAGTITDGSETIVFSEIERFILTEYDDSIVGYWGGAHSISGGDGSDTIYGGMEADTIEGGDGADSLWGEEGNDTLLGGAGDDTIGGMAGNDSVEGGEGNDSLRGGGGADTLRGDEGDDTLIAGADSDVLDGGAGDDSLTGGDGDDTFSYGIGDGADTITDFNVGATGTLNDGDDNNNDFIDLSPFYDDIRELHADQADDDILNQSNTTTANGRVVDYSDNAEFGAGDSLTFTGASADGSSFTSENTGVVCFAGGTRILTPRGEVPVERLCVGDLVTTLDNGPQPLLWAAGRRLGPAALAAAPHLCPVEIAPGAFGNDRPLVVSPQHGVLLGLDGDHILARAIHLARLPGGAVRQRAGCRAVTYWHLFFERHQVVFSNGLPSETYYPGPQSIASLTPDCHRSLARLLPGINAIDTLKQTRSLYGPPAHPYSRTRSLPNHLQAFKAAA